MGPSIQPIRVCFAVLATLVAADIQAECRKSLEGTLDWESRQGASVDPRVARQQAIDEALVELVRQNAGVNVRSYERSELTVRNDSLSSLSASSSFSKARAQVIRYDILALEVISTGDFVNYKMRLKGDVCIDKTDASVVVVALRGSEAIPSDVMTSVASYLSDYFSLEPNLTLADPSNQAAYSDIDAVIKMSEPNIEKVDRSAAIRAIKAQLGADAVQDIRRFGTNITLNVVIEADLPDVAGRIVSAGNAEREIPDSRSPGAAVIREMQIDAADEASRKFARAISNEFQ